MRTSVELVDEEGAGASEEPRPGGYRSSTEGLDPSGRMDGVRRFGTAVGGPLNKGDCALSLASRIEFGIRVFGHGTVQSQSGGNPDVGFGERQETSDIGRWWERLPRDSAIRRRV